MLSRLLYPLRGASRRGLAVLVNEVTLGASGAISSQTSEKDAGFVVAQTGSETGRYTITLSDPEAAIVFIGVQVVGADDAAYTAGKGLLHFTRNLSASVGYVQFARVNGTTDYNDTLPEDSAKLRLLVITRGV